LGETVNGTSRNYQWQYDNLYRLTNEGVSITAPGTVFYQYDPVGNRTARQSTISQLPTASYSYTTNDWLATDKYDLNGNTTNSGTVVYQYDVMNHLTNANGIILTYDGDGNRVSKTVGGATVYYLVDDQNPSGYSQVLEEYRGSALTNVYNYGTALINQEQFAPNSYLPSTISYYVSDGHGSTRMLTDIGGTVVNVMVYDSYGNLIASNGMLQTAYLYSGQQFDSDLGLYLNRARYLSTGTGRFWTMDGDYGNNEDPLSLHKYLYAADDPVDYDDPSGNDPTINDGFNIGLATIFLPVKGILAQAGGGAAPRLGAFGGTAGPDVTIMLMHTLQDVRQTFKNEPLAVREHAASGLCAPEIASGWEIRELNDLDYGNETVGEFGPTASYGTGLGAGTVQFGFPPKVYSAGAVNYALWGAMYELAEETFFSSSAPISNPLAGSAVGDTFSEINANITARTFKAFFHGDFDSYKAKEASAFVSYGYRYGFSYYDPSSTAIPITGDYGNESSTPNGRFKWQWLGIPGHDTPN
jgi:RHS repeat-associated protein